MSSLDFEIGLDEMQLYLKHWKIYVKIVQFLKSHNFFESSISVYLKSMI